MNSNGRVRSSGHIGTNDADQKQRQLRVRGPEVREPQHIEALEVPGAWAPFGQAQSWNQKKRSGEQHEN